MICFYLYFSAYQTNIYIYICSLKCVCVCIECKHPLSPPVWDHHCQQLSQHGVIIAFCLHLSVHFSCTKMWIGLFMLLCDLPFHLPLYPGHVTWMYLTFNKLHSSVELPQHLVHGSQRQAVNTAPAPVSAPWRLTPDVFRLEGASPASQLDRDIQEDVFVFGKVAGGLNTPCSR